MSIEHTVHLEGDIIIHTEFKTLRVSHRSGHIRIVDKDTGEIIYQYEAPLSGNTASDYIRRLIFQQEGD